MASGCSRKLQACVKGLNWSVSSIPSIDMKARGQLETADTCIDSVKSGIHYCLRAEGAFELRKEIFLTNWAQSLSTLTRHPALTTFHCGVESSSHALPASHTAQQVRWDQRACEVCVPCFRPWTAVARHTEITATLVRRRPAVKLKEFDHPTLERAFNLDTNIVITRQLNGGAQLFSDVDVTPESIAMPVVRPEADRDTTQRIANRLEGTKNSFVLEGTLEQ